MKRLILLMIFGVLLVGSIGLVVGEQGNGNGNNDASVCDADNLELCLDETTCETAGGGWDNGVCWVDDEDEDEKINCSDYTYSNCPEGCLKKCLPSVCSGGECTADCEGEGSCYSKDGLGQTIRNRVKAGVYTSPEGEQIRVRELAQNRLLLHYNNDTAEAETELEIEEETENNKTKLKVKLSNGRKAEIKIMPGVASETALARLRLKVCNSDNNCTIELKEVGKGEGNKTKLAYELQAQRHMKLLGMFRIKAMNKVQIDAETGEIIIIKKPWWAFLATDVEDEEDEEEDEETTE